MSELYLRVREKEGRLYPDTIVARLPQVPRDHPFSTEWRSRADSCARLTRYIATHNRSLSVLELGCGNGWLSHRISLVPATNVWGIDRASPELTQAARVFRQSNLVFLAADIFNPPFDSHPFDEIVLASVIQYFPDLPRLIHTLQVHLTLGGEIHILDSPLYRPEELSAARERTHAYYATLGFPEMAEQYHHHSTTELEEFTPHWLYRPNSLLPRLARRVGQNPAPFPWLVIRL